MLRLWDVDWQAICSYHQKSRFFRLLLVLAVFLACVTWLEGGSPQCVPSKSLHHVTLQGGIAAGDYVKIGPVVSPTACANICCKDSKCDVAFMANNMCYNLHCYSAKLCQARPAKESRFVVSVTYIERGVNDEGRTILDRETPGKGGKLENSTQTTKLIGQNSGIKVIKQDQENNLVHLYNSTQSKISQSSASHNERTKLGPSKNGNSESSYIRNSTTASASRNLTSPSSRLNNFHNEKENGTLQFESNDTPFSQGNYSKQKNQTNELTKMVNHSNTQSNPDNPHVMVAWKNASHILVKEVMATSLNGTGIGTGETNYIASSNNSGITMSSFGKQQLKFINVTAAKNGNFKNKPDNSIGSQQFSKAKLLKAVNSSMNESLTKKEKLDEELLDKSFYNVNSSGNATQSNDTEISFTSAKKGVLKGKSFKSKEKGTQLDISSPTSSLSGPPSAYRSNATSTVKTNGSSSETSLSVQPVKKGKCYSGGILFNKTLVAGLKSGDFTDYGKVQGMDKCVGFCCADKKCDMALMLGTTCYTLHCAGPSLCKVRPAHPSALNPRISFIYRDKLDNNAVKDNQTENKNNQTESNLHQTATQAKQVSKRVKGSRCKHGAIQHGVTLHSGQKAGIFKLRLKAKDMDSCLDMCCKDNTCNVAFLIDDSCYSVRCHSHEDCTISKAKSSRARSTLSVVRSRILPLNDKRQQIPRVEKKYTTILNITNQLFTKPLADFESLEFLNLAERVQVAVSTVLATFKDYKESEVISFQPIPLITKLEITLYDGAPIKDILVKLVKIIKDGKMESSIDGSVLTFLVSTTGFKFYSPKGFNLVCDPEFNYDVHWKLTVFNFQTTSPCPRNAQGETRRSCHGSDKTNATWGFPSFVNCVSSEYKTLQSKAKTFAEGAKKKTPFKTLQSQLGTTPSDILIRIQKLTFVDTYRALLDKPHNSSNTTLLHDGSNTTHGHQLKNFNPKLSNATLFANNTFSIPLPDNKNVVQPIPFKLVSKQKVANSSNGRAFQSPPVSLPPSTNTTLNDKIIPKALPQTMATKASSNSTLFSDIFPQPANVNKFSRMNIPKPGQGKTLEKPVVASKSNVVKPYSLNRSSFGKIPLMGAQKVQNSVGSSYNKNINLLNKKMGLPFRKGFPYDNQQQQKQQKITATGVTNTRYQSLSNNLGYPKKQFNQFEKKTQAAATSSYPSQLGNSKNIIQNPQSTYAAYKQQLQRLRFSQSSQSSLFNKQPNQNVQNWQVNQYGNAYGYGNQLGQGTQGSQSGQSNQLTKTNNAWQNVQRSQGNQAWRGYPGQASFPGYGGITGYSGTSLQGQPGNQNGPQMDIGRRRKRDIHVNLKRTKRQGGNMVWYNNYNLRQPSLRNQVYRPSPTISEDNEDPFLTNVQTGYDNPKGLLNQQDPLSYNVDYFHRPTPYYPSITYTLGGKEQPSPTRAPTSQTQSEISLFPTNGVTDQASTRGSFSSPGVPGNQYPAGFTDLQAPSEPSGKSQDLAGFDQPQVQQEFVPTNKPFTLPITTTKNPFIVKGQNLKVQQQFVPTNKPFNLPITTTKNPFFMKKQNPKVTSSTISPSITTQATLKSKQDTKPISKPSTISLKPTTKPSADVTQSSAELLKKKLMDMVKNKGTVKPLINIPKHDIIDHVMDDVYQEKTRAPMFGGDIALIVDTLRQLSLYNKYTNPPETIDTLKQFLQVGSHILDRRNKHEWKYLTKESPSSISALDAAEVIESYSKIVAEKLHPDDMKKPILTTNIMVTLKSIDLMTIDLSQDLQLPNYSHPAIANWTDATDKLVISPRSLVNAPQVSKQSIQLISCNVRRITDLLPRSLVAKTFGNNSIIGGHVMSVSASPSLGEDIDPPIRIVLDNNNKDVSNFEQKCVYWKKSSSPGKSRWSSHGCRFVESNLTHTTCECTHMSTFSAIANTAKPKAIVPATVPPTTAPPPEEEGSNLLYILLCILGLLLILFILLVIICLIIKRRKRQNDSKDSRSGRQGRAAGRRSIARSDDSISTGSGEFDDMLASRRRNVHPEKSASADSPRWQRMRKNGENPENLMLKEKSYLMSDYHQPYHFSSSKSPPPTESSSHRNRSRSS